MTRAETTKFLGQLLVATRIGGAGSHWASEVSIDPWTSKAKRVDYMEFCPANQYSVSGIEKAYSLAMRSKVVRKMFIAVMV